MKSKKKKTLHARLTELIMVFTNTTCMFKINCLVAAHVNTTPRQNIAWNLMTGQNGGADEPAHSSTSLKTSLGWLNKHDATLSLEAQRLVCLQAADHIIHASQKKSETIFTRMSKQFRSPFVLPHLTGSLVSKDQTR